MATINEVIERLNRQSPGAVESRDIASWLIGLDGRLFSELGMSAGSTRPQKWPEDGDVPLTAPPPYDGLYDLYALLKVQFIRRDYDEYNNTAIAYNDAVNEYRKAYRRENMPELIDITV